MHACMESHCEAVICQHFFTSVCIYATIARLHNITGDCVVFIHPELELQLVLHHILGNFFLLVQNFVEFLEEIFISYPSTRSYKHTCNAACFLHAFTAYPYMYNVIHSFHGIRSYTHQLTKEFPQAGYKEHTTCF